MRITDFPILDEIKAAYTELRQNGHNRNCAVEALKESYRNELSTGNADDGLLFWIGLADAQYALKELSAEVAEKGLSALAKIKKTDWIVTPGDLVRREERYAKAPMPERRKVNKPKRFHCQWQIGDTFAYLLHGPYAQEFGFDGRYILLRKVNETVMHNGCVVPVVTVTMWDDSPLPATSQEFMRMPMLKLDYGRGLPYGLFLYRAEMMIEKEKDLAALNLRYIGNYQNIPMPEDEGVIEYEGVMVKIALNRFDQRCSYFCRNHPIFEEMFGIVH